ncbi:hypothetical protein HPB47_000343 [Ixodes persulcatus]|uniref:Uncharacterized protein n=1 Tax=Ixodes persulcatus TaxID=34615 RepID=A0AC60PTE7_IXOPE|nr:hypothetical protein HPB47_000343 [Ixodes persulcatus]
MIGPPALLNEARGFGDYGNAVESRGPSTGPSYAVERNDYHHEPLWRSTGARWCQLRPGDTNASPQMAGPHQGFLLMVYALNSDSDKMNAEKLVNLLCQCGNVVKIKFLKNEGRCSVKKRNTRTTRSSSRQRCSTAGSRSRRP